MKLKSSWHEYLMARHRLVLRKQRDPRSTSQPYRLYDCTHRLWRLLGEFHRPADVRFFLEGYHYALSAQSWTPPLMRTAP
jgi:hypothetical protein